MPRQPDSAPVTWGDLRWAYKKLDARIDEAFDAIHTGDDAQKEFWDEHEEKLNRNTRSIARLKKELEGEG